MGDIRISSLTKENEKLLLELMNSDRISHFFSIYDLQHCRGKTQIWLAQVSDKIVGYLLEYDRNILCLRGPKKFVVPSSEKQDYRKPC